MAETATTTDAPAKAAAPATETKAVDPKAAPVATPEPTKEIVVNGKKLQVTEKQLIALAQKGYFADNKLKSVEVLQNKTATLLNDLKTPEGILKTLKDPSLGANPKEVFKKLMASDVIDDELKEEMSAWVYKNVVQQSKLTPEQIEQQKKLSDYERLKAQEEKRKADEQTKAQQEQIEQVRQAIRAEVGKQLKDDKTFPLIEGSVRQIFDKIRVMNKKGAPVTSETVTKAIAEVRKDILTHQQNIFDAIEDPEALVKFFGEARALKISKALIARLKAKGKVEAKKTETQEEGVREKITDKIDKKFNKTPHGYTVLDI